MDCQIATRETQRAMSLWDLWCSACRTHADRPALRYRGEEITYAELDRQTQRLIGHLLELGVSPHDRIGIALERSPHIAVAILAVLGVGATYVPLDPRYPTERLAFMLRDSRPKVLITQRAVADRVTVGEGMAVLLLDQPLSVSARDPEPEREPAHLAPAYLIYTSGSSGQPKGVLLGREPLANLMAWQIRDSQAAAGWRTLQFTSLSFDVHFQEFFGTWATGGTLVLIDEVTRRDPAALLEFIAEERIARLFLPFVALQSLVEIGTQRERFPECLREVITAGEQLKITPELRQFFSRLPTCSLHNHYGPSETHVVTAHTLSGDPTSWPSLPPIGLPLPGVELQLVGDRGELYIGGVALAEGYHDRPELTAERFVWLDGQRYFRTGDRIRKNANGEYEFLGRLDTQVKIRGYRVEPGEVEEVLRAHPAVGQTAVVVQDDPVDVKRLAAYWVPRVGFGQTAFSVRQHLREHLPDYMVPAAIVQLDALPLTPTGKVDRVALSQFAARRPQVNTAPDHRDGVEEQLARIWSEVLGEAAVRRLDDFFERGGDSLLAARLILRVERTFGVRMPMASLFQHTTLERFAAAIRDAKRRGASGCVQASQTPCIVPIRATGNGSIAFWVSGATIDASVLIGYSSLLARLARRLDPDRRHFQLCFEYGPDGPVAVTIEHVADTFLRDVRTIQPEGPYTLAGWSLGGLVAFEMAQQLRAAGQSVELLALFDTSSRGYPARRGWAGWVRASLRAWGECKGREWWLYPAFGLGSSVGAAGIAIRRWFGRRFGVQNPWRHLMRIEGNYVEGLKPYDGDLTLFPAAETLAATARQSSFIPDPALGWQGFAHSVEVHPIQGNHDSMFNEPGLSEIVEVLSEKLEEIRGRR